MYWPTRVAVRLVEEELVEGEEEMRMDMPDEALAEGGAMPSLALSQMETPGMEGWKRAKCWKEKLLV